MAKRFVKGCPSRTIEDCDYPPIDGWYYTIGDKWAYIWRGGTKKYRLQRSYESDVSLWQITKRNSGKVRSILVMRYIHKYGEEV